jgi:hypothetical protein
MTTVSRVTEYRSALPRRLSLFLLELAVTASGRRWRAHHLEPQAVLARELPYISLLNRLNYVVLCGGLEGHENHTSGELYSLERARWVTGG